MIEIESVQHSNIEESEMGQLHALHLNDNAIARVRAAMPTGPSLEECEECDNPIPVERQKAYPGCRLCVHCKAASERAFKR